MGLNLCYCYLSNLQSYGKISTLSTNKEKIWINIRKSQKWKFSSLVDICNLLTHYSVKISFEWLDFLYSGLFSIFNFSVSPNYLDCNTKTQIIKKLNNFPYIYFTYLEGFDDVSTAILIDKKINKELNNQIAHWSTKPALYSKNQSLMLNSIDKDLWLIIAKRQNRFDLNTGRLYEFYPNFNSYTNYNIEKIINFIFEKVKIFNLNFVRALFLEILKSFYFELNFFFRDAPIQNLDDFRLVCFFRERALLLEERVFSNKKRIFNNKKHIFPPLSHLDHEADFKVGYKNLWRLFKYKLNNNKSYYLNIEDPQTYAIDKKFVHIWDYEKGSVDAMNFWGPTGGTGAIGFYREKLFTPRVHLPSKLYWYDNGYGSLSNKIFEFGYFPDYARYNGHLNPAFDKIIFGYAWFFHHGYNYFDNLHSLEMLRHHVTYNYWGDYDNMEDDYTAYQPTFLWEGVAGKWLAVIILLGADYDKYQDFKTAIKECIETFHINKVWYYKRIKAKHFFDLEPMERLEKMRDPITFKTKSNTMTRFANVFFCYNFSGFQENQPKWFLKIRKLRHIYKKASFDSVEDEWLDAILRKTIFNMGVNYDKSVNISLYFNYQNNQPSTLFDLLNYFNQKIFDNFGFFNTSLNKVETHRQIENFRWLNLFSIVYAESSANLHYSWQLTLFNQYTFDWSVIYKILIIKIDPITFFFKSFINIKLFEDFISFGQIVNGRFLHATKTFTTGVIGLEMDFFKLLPFFEYYLGTTSGYKFGLFISNYLWSLINFTYFYTTYLTERKLAFYFTELLNYFQLENFSFLDRFHLDFFRFITKFLKENIIDNFFITYYPKITIKKITNIAIDGSNFQNINIFILKNVKSSHETLSYVFFLPYINYSQENSLNLILVDLAKVKFYPTLLTGEILPLNDLVKLEEFIGYWAILSLKNSEASDYYISEYIHALNKIDWSLNNQVAQHSLEYNWYWNYVIKPKLYKKP
jgi:hypothetical protein